MYIYIYIYMYIYIYIQIHVYVFSSQVPGMASLNDGASDSLKTDNALAESPGRRLAASALRSRPISINFRSADGAPAWRGFGGRGVEDFLGKNGGKMGKS